MDEGAQDLAQLVHHELARAAPNAALKLAEAIRKRVGSAVAAIVFYGSCLRKQTSEGVLDFYVLVDDYASASSSRWLAWAGSALPPNVFYIECAGDGETLRSKFAVVSLRDFAQGAAPAGWRPGIWARFCQPALAVYVRDANARSALEEACLQAIITAVRCIAPLLPAPATAEEFWQAVFRETYAAEMRTEHPETIRSLYLASADRYDRALRSALAALDIRGVSSAKWTENRFALELPPGAGQRARCSWRLRRPIAKLVYVAQLLKTASTFGDWVPYALWKVERHTGTHIEYSERQRRHPFIWGWPLIFRVLRNRDLR
jgi:hypothetical protein